MELQRFRFFNPKVDYTNIFIKDFFFKNKMSITGYILLLR